MAKRKSAEDISGSTFADLYDVQEELGRKALKPMGRPRNKIQRKPTTVYLTKEETTMLRRLHLNLNEHIAVNKSQLIGMAIELISDLVSAHDEDGELFEGIRNLEGVQQKLQDLMMI